MQIDVDPLMVGEANNVEPLDVIMVEATEGFDKGEDVVADNKVLSSVYPKHGEGLLKFLERCHKNNSQLGLYLRCDVVYDVDAAKRIRFDPRQSQGR